ncbi:sugar ABC transporter substrate-binding protein [Hypericibacter sp.]|uniref:sugar ABC transporter substrate-binding protein n=1 Tax=Hypericibacter sp. TaxID=2705401 RepID=UPI003D6CDEDD
MLTRAHIRSSFLRYGLALFLAAPAFCGIAQAADLSTKKVILVTCGPANPWCKVFNERIVAGLEAAGVKVSVLESDLDPVQEVQQMNQAISQKPDLLMVEPADDKTLIASVKKARAAGVPVLYMDSPADPSILDDIAVQVIADNAALGRFAAQNIIDGLRERGLKSANVIVITGTAGSTMVQDRQKGFEEVMATAPEYKIIDVQDSNWDPVQSGKIAQQLFAKYNSQGGVDAVRADADYMAIPIIEAAKQAGMKVGVKNDGLIVTGTNCTAEGIQAIKAGDMYGTATEDAWTQGNVTAETAIAFLKGETVPKTVIVPEFRVHAPTLDKYAELCSKS